MEIPESLVYRIRIAYSRPHWHPYTFGLYENPRGLASAFGQVCAAQRRYQIYADREITVTAERMGIGITDSPSWVEFERQTFTPGSPPS